LVYWSLVIGHWSLVIGHWSLVIGHWSLVIGHWSFKKLKILKLKIFKDQCAMTLLRDRIIGKKPGAILHRPPADCSNNSPSTIISFRLGGIGH